MADSQVREQSMPDGVIQLYEDKREKTPTEALHWISPGRKKKPKENLRRRNGKGNERDLLKQQLQKRFY